jgi:DNA-binding MarR family transcriptional regulator/GNAT superfamily N-acetyltransferase
MVDQTLDSHVSALREFNRFYTARLGLLRKRHLDGDYSLTEARILYEIGARPGITARSLCASLELDPGYMSRLLGSLARRKLIGQATSELDGREKRLTLTSGGVKSVAHLNEESNRHIKEILSTISELDRTSLVESLTRAKRIFVARAEPELTISRLTHAVDEALQILDEYYEAVHVIQRDGPGALESLLADPASAMWLGKLNTEVVGCVVLRSLPSIPHAGECKRLYVRPTARGRHVASMLLDRLEEHARTINLEWIYLDTYDDLKPAIALYERRGYERCERYNNNPQATLFMRKRLSSLPTSS